MSIFSHIRKSRRQAKEHNAKLAEQARKEQQKVPYKHVPTHAASDAFASAPPSWREADRQRILEENRRRSAMAASGHHMNMPGVPRIGSSLSHVSYPGEDATPIVRVPRTYSYNGLAPYADRSRQVVYSVPDICSPQPSPFKAKDVDRALGHDAQRLSPTPSKGEPSPVESSSGSTSSQDDLEMRPSRPATRAPVETMHRLPPGRPRRASDASIERLAMANLAKAPGPSAYLRDARPPPSMRGFASIAQVAIPPPMYLGPLPPAPTGRGSYTNVSSTSGTLASRQSSTTSLPALTPASSRPPLSAPVTPRMGPQPERRSSWASVPSAELDAPRSCDSTGTADGPAQPRSKDQRAIRTSRPPELGRIESVDTEPPCQGPVPSRGTPSAVAHEHLVNVFPEPVMLPHAAAPPSNKAAKGGGKLFKKNRWSSSKPSAVAA